MRASTLTILVGIALCSALLLFEPGGLLRGAKPRPAPGLVFFDLGRATGIQFDGPAKCGFERNGNQWTFSQPKGAPVRSGSVERLLDRLSTLRATSVLNKEEREARNMTLPSLGLDPAKARIRVKAGDSVQTLLIGDRTAFKNSVFAHELGSDLVMTVPVSILTVFPDDPFTLRETTLGIPAPSSLVRVEMDRADGFFQASRKDGEPWQLSQPQRSRLDQERVHHFIDSLASARMEQIVTDTPGDLGQYGLAERLLEFRWWTQGEINPHRLRVGAPVPDTPGFVYAQMGDFPTVFTLPEGAKAVLETPIMELRDKRLLPLEADEITGVRLMDDASQPVTLGRDGDGWQILEPIQSAADKERVESLVREWATANALRFPPGDLSQALGFTNTPPADLSPDYRLVFQRDATTLPPAEAVRQIDVYRNGERSFAHLTQENIVAEIPNPLVATLSLDSLRYCDRQIIQVQPRTVTGVVRMDEGGTQRFQREADTGNWVVEKDACILNENLFEKLLATLCTLQAERLVTRDPPTTAQYGLDRPQLQLTIAMRDGPLLRQTLLLGKALPAGNGHYAMVRGQDVVFTLDQTVSAPLLTSICLSLP